MYETLLLKQSDIKELSDMKEIIGYVETAYSVDANRKVQMPSKMYLFFNKYEGDLRIMPCFIRGLDQAGVERRERLVPEPPAVERARPVILDDDVGRRHEPAQQVLPRGRGQVQRD